jgi:putative Ig domain-containing protein
MLSDCNNTDVARVSGVVGGRHRVLANAFDSRRLGGAVRELVRFAHVDVRRFKSFRFALLLSSALVVAACGGGDGDDTAAAVNPPANPPGNPPAGNQSPTISGTPASQVMQSTAYAFTPTASDPDAGTTLTFSIANKPSWASFNTSTGALTGTPTSANVGNYQNIQIAVSDGTATANLASFAINVVATASGAATLSWTPPTQNTDGTPLTDLAGYRVYWGTSQGNYPNQKDVNGGGTSSIVDSLTPATYYFVVTALDTAGNESTYSNVATKVVM